MSLTREQYMERKLAGVCTVNGCTEKQRETALTCEKHGKRNRESRDRWRARCKENRESEAATNRKRRVECAEQGKCGRCGRRQLATVSMCDECHDGRTEEYAAGRPPWKPQRKCSVCHEPGHNHRTCKKKRMPIEHYALARVA